jgi:hypothetical protein
VGISVRARAGAACQHLFEADLLFKNAKCIEYEASAVCILLCCLTLHLAHADKQSLKATSFIMLDIFKRALN